MSSHIIIDANIAKSCADPGRHHTSIACLRFVKFVGQRNSGFDVLLTPILLAEWHKHASPTFKRWWASMESRRRVRTESDKRVADYRAAIAELESAKARTEVTKDAHLVEAAVLHGTPIASQDDAQAEFVRLIAQTYPLVGQVQWFNPVTDDAWHSWMTDGCVDGSRALQRPGE